MSQDEIKTLKDDQAPSAVAPAAAPKLNLRRLQTIQRVLQYVAVLVLLVFIGLIGLSWFQLRSINNEIATVDKRLSDKKLEIARLKVEADNLRVEADNLRRDKSGLQEVNNALTVVTRSLGEQENAEKVKQVIEDSIEPTNDPNKIPPRIYIQVVRSDQRKRAAEVARKLQALGYVVPGLESSNSFALNQIPGIANVPPAPRVSELRYYQETAVSQQDIKGILDVVGGMGVNLKQVVLPPSRRVRPRHYEIFFGDDF